MRGSTHTGTDDIRNRPARKTARIYYTDARGSRGPAAGGASNNPRAFSNATWGTGRPPTVWNRPPVVPAVLPGPWAPFRPWSPRRAPRPHFLSRGQWEERAILLRPRRVRFPNARRTYTRETLASSATKKLLTLVVVARPSLATTEEGPLCQSLVRSFIVFRSKRSRMYAKEKERTDFKDDAEPIDQADQIVCDAPRKRSVTEIQGYWPLLTMDGVSRMGKPRDNRGEKGTSPERVFRPCGFNAPLRIN